MVGYLILRHVNPKYTLLYRSETFKKKLLRFQVIMMIYNNYNLNYSK